MSNLYKVTAGNSPLTSDVNQIVDAFNGNFDVGQITLAPHITPPSGTFSALATTGTALSIGQYIYALTYVVGYKKSDNTYVYGNETNVSTSFTVTTTSGNQAVSISGMPTSWPSTAIALRIYRTTVGGANGTQKLVTTLNAPVATYTDTTADGSLGASMPTVNATGTSIGGSNTDTIQIKALEALTDTRSVSLSYTNGYLTQVVETDPNTSAVVRTTTLNYDVNNNLTSVVETIGNITITTTFTNTGGLLSSVTKAVQ